MTLKERDIETGLDYFGARYYASTQGRFTSADRPFMDQHESDPQSWNLYTYVGSSPINFTDPFGLWKKVDCDNGGQCWQAEEGDTWATVAWDAGLGHPASHAPFLAFYFQATPAIIAGETTVDVSGYRDWYKSLDFNEAMRLNMQVQWEVDFGMGGGLRNAAKAASKAGLFSRFARWLGFGKKATSSAGEGVAALRQAYEAEVKALAGKAAQMKASGHTVEQIAIELHAERRALGIKYKDITPPEILQQILERNLRIYGDELGPSIEWLRKQGKSWENIIESASRPGGGDLKP